MKQVLITGATGFAGSFLAEYLVSLSDYKVTGTYVTQESLKNIESVKDKASFVMLDLLDKEAVLSLIQKTQPDLIFHLAALASPSASFKDPAGTITNNITAQVNLLEAVNAISLKPLILIVSSADVYGIVDVKNLPINELVPLNPTNPYAVSKIAQDFLGLQYSYSYKLPIVRVRPFNHIGPRQALGFVVSDFAKRIVEMEKGNTPPILKVGNLDAKRDFTDVRDMVKAYVGILEKGKIGEVYNIGSGVSHSMREILDMLKSQAKIDFSLQEDQLLLRPSDNPELIADTTKLQSVIDWKAEIPLEQSLGDVLDYWRNQN